MEQNKRQKSAENKSLNESHISSSAAGMDPKDEEIRKLKAKLKQIKMANSNQFGDSSMMQMGIQIGEIFCKMEKEIDGMKEKLAKMDGMGKKMKEIEVKNTELEEQIVAKNREMDKMKAKIQSLAKENEDLKKEMAKVKTEFVGKNTEFEKKMHESLEKKANKEMLDNLIGRIDGMELIQLKNNKWNAADCGPKLDISDGGLVVKHSSQNERNCIRAISPISPFNLNSTKPSIACYFEVQIVHKNPSRNFSIDIGFCTQQFPLENKWLGNEANSIGIDRKAGMDIDGKFKEFGNNADGYFNVGDVIGAGIIHSPANKSMKCFAIWNGQFLGTIELPDKFLSLQLFPAATLFYAGQSIRANFGTEKWLYDPNKILQ